MLATLTSQWNDEPFEDLPKCRNFHLISFNQNVSKRLIHLRRSKPSSGNFGAETRSVKLWGSTRKNSPLLTTTHCIRHQNAKGIYRMWQTSDMQGNSHCSPPLASGSKYTTNVRGVYWYVGFRSSFLVGRFCVCSTSLQQIQLNHSNKEIKLQYQQKPLPTPRNLALQKCDFLLSPFYSGIRILSWMMFLVCLEDQPRTWMRG